MMTFEERVIADIKPPEMGRHEISLDMSFLREDRLLGLDFQSNLSAFRYLATEVHEYIRVDVVEWCNENLTACRFEIDRRDVHYFNGSSWKWHLLVKFSCDRDYVLFKMFWL